MNTPEVLAKCRVVGSKLYRSLQVYQRLLEFSLHRKRAAEHVVETSVGRALLQSLFRLGNRPRQIPAVQQRSRKIVSHERGSRILFERLSKGVCGFAVFARRA